MENRTNSIYLPVPKFFTKSMLQTAAVIGMAVVLLWVVFLAISSGQTKAQSETVVQTVLSLKAGLEKFYGDQDRYPTASEFGDVSDSSAMKNYFIPFPPQNFATVQCPKSFDYKRPAADRYQLYFCLPQAFGSYQQGWSVIDYRH